METPLRILLGGDRASVQVKRPGMSCKLDNSITLALILSYNACAPFHGSHGAYSLSSKLAHARRLEGSGHLQGKGKPARFTW